MISFAGGLPAPELFGAPRCAPPSTPRCGRGRRPLAAVLHDRGQPRAARPGRRPAHGPRPASHADQLLITSGSQQALTLIATVLLEPGDTVLVEEPSYLAALQAFQLAGASIVPVPCDEDGLDPDAVAALAERHDARLLYTIPTFQNPTAARCRSTAARRSSPTRAGCGFWLLEDDPYGELRYSGAPLPPLAAIGDDGDELVLSLSTLSKIAAPGLRIGWVRAPPRSASR